MISVDGYLLDFVSNNWLTITAVLAVLKGIAKVTPSTTDDKIYTFLSNIVTVIKPSGKR